MYIGTEGVGARPLTASACAKAAKGEQDSRTSDCLNSDFLSRGGEIRPHGSG